MEAPRVWYVNVFVSDLPRAVSFYRNMLGLPLAFQDERFGYASFETEGLRLGLACVDPQATDATVRPGRHTGIGLGVPDLVAAHRRLEAAGIRFTMPPTKQPWGGFMAMFDDPDGNVFYLDQLGDRT
jgi:predicted enzyme related to lactoylglutathione lyase